MAHRAPRHPIELSFPTLKMVRSSQSVCVELDSCVGCIGPGSASAPSVQGTIWREPQEEIPPPSPPSDPQPDDEDNACTCGFATGSHNVYCRTGCNCECVIMANSEAVFITFAKCIASIHVYGIYMY